MAFPLIWPKIANGPGRVLEFSVRHAADVEIQRVPDHHAFRQILIGPDSTQKTNMIFSLTDWASGPEYDAHLASMHAEASKEMTHGIDIREGPATTPAAAWYIVAGMRCPEENKAALAAALDAYLRGIFHCGTFAPVFHHVGVSTTDPQMVLSVQGWPSREAADEYWHSNEHWAFYPAVKDLMVMDLGPFQGALSGGQQQ